MAEEVPWEEGNYLVLTRSYDHQGCGQQHWDVHGFASEADALEFIQTHTGSEERVPVLPLEIGFVASRREE